MFYVKYLGDKNSILYYATSHLVCIILQDQRVVSFASVRIAAVV